MGVAGNVMLGWRTGSLELHLATQLSSFCNPETFRVVNKLAGPEEKKKQLSSTAGSIQAVHHTHL